MKALLKFIILLAPLTLLAEQKSVSGPDGRLRVIVSDNEGKPAYSVSYEGVEYLKDSPLGLKTNIGDFSSNLRLCQNYSTSNINETYSLSTIKKSNIEYKANEVVYTFRNDSCNVFDVEIRVSNNDVAFRYKIYDQGQTNCCIVWSESTAFVMPQGVTTFLCPQSKPMGGFARTSPSYETSYTLDDTTGKNGWGEGYTFPCLFRNGTSGWMLISETGVNSSYCASRLIGHSDGLYTIGFPQEGENNGKGSVSPSIPLPGYTPWRTITIGNTLAPIVESTVTFDVVEPLYESSKKYIYGNGSWSWIIGMDPATNYDEQIRYIDFSAEMGYQSVLVDALWDTQIGRDRIETLSRYALGKGVALYLWYNSNGSWNDAPQTPRGIMDNTIARRREMKWLQSIGVRGIKVDFFGGDKQCTMQLYEDILSDANDYGLMVIFHGCTLPRGWERMYPNYASSEAVLASENLSFSQHSCDMEAVNACIHPIVRNSVGSMDFGGSALNKFYNAANSPGGSKRITSDVYALATAVLFQSPVQHFALAPNNLKDAPEWAIEFMKQVPTLWDDVKFISGYPGQFIIMERRSGNKKYIAGVNATQDVMKFNYKVSIQSDVENNKRIVIYEDDFNLYGSKREIKFSNNLNEEIAIPKNGAFVIVID